MLRIIGILIVYSLLTACAYLNSSSEDHYARCKELKHRLIVNGATNNQLVAAQQSAELDNLNRNYREEGCS